MTLLKTIWSRFTGLFVDDGSLAVAVLAWLAAAWLLLPRLPLPPALPSTILSAGLASILIESASRRARQGS